MRQTNREMKQNPDLLDLRNRAECLHGTHSVGKDILDGVECVREMEKEGVISCMKA